MFLLVRQSLSSARGLGRMRHSFSPQNESQSYWRRPPTSETSMSRRCSNGLSSLCCSGQPFMRSQRWRQHQPTPVCRRGMLTPLFASSGRASLKTSFAISMGLGQPSSSLWSRRTFPFLEMVLRRGWQTGHLCLQEAHLHRSVSPFWVPSSNLIWWGVWGDVSTTGPGASSACRTTFRRSWPHWSPQTDQFSWQLQLQCSTQETADSSSHDEGQEERPLVVIPYVARDERGHQVGLQGVQHQSSLQVWVDSSLNVD